MNIILGETKARGKMIEVRIDAILSSIRNSEILVGYQARRVDHPQLQWSILVEIPRRDEDKPQAHEMLALLVEAARSAGPGRYVLRGYPNEAPADLWTHDPSPILSFEGSLIWGLPLEIRIRSAKTPPVVRISWPWITAFMRENAQGVMKPEKVIYSTPPTCLFDHLRELLQYGGQRIEFIYDEE